MSDNNPSERLGRRSFLNRMAVAAGAAQLSPKLLAAAVPVAVAVTAETKAAEGAAKHLSGYTTKLAQYAAALRYEDVPAEVRQRVKNCITDTVAVILYGGQLPWSQIIIAHAKRTGPGGKSAILGGADFSTFLYGPTGVFKTELSALIEQHFGAGFDSRHLPANFTSTANASESLAFAAKDAILVVDKLHPPGERPWPPLPSLDPSALPSA